MAVIDEPRFQSRARDFWGVDSIVVQLGVGTHIPEARIQGIDVEWFRLKKTIKEDIESADLVITHAGAGSILDVLEAGKPVIAVVNNSLLDNHQLELAHKMAEEEFIFAVDSPEKLEDVFSCDFGKLRKFPGFPTKKFIQEIKNFIKP